MKIEVVKLEDLSKSAWHEMLQSASDVNYFCSVEYWQTFDESYCLTLSDNSNKLCGGIIFSIEKVVPVFGDFFKVSRAESSIVLIKEVSNVIQVKSDAFNYLFEFLKYKKVIYFTITPKVRSNDFQVFEYLNINSTKCGTYLMTLSESIEDIYKAFSKGCKSSVQKALKSGVVVKIYKGKNALEHIPEYLNLQNSLIHRRKNQFSALYIKGSTFFRKIFNQELADNFLALAYYDNQPAAGAIITVYNDNMFYYQGASDYNLTKESQAANLLQFEIIKHGKHNLYSTYDFGGADLHASKVSPLYGVYAFKKSFGGKGAEFDCFSIVLNKTRFGMMWKLKNLQNSHIVKLFFKMIKR